MTFVRVSASQSPMNGDKPESLKNKYKAIVKGTKFRDFFHPLPKSFSTIDLLVGLIIQIIKYMYIM